MQFTTGNDAMMSTAITNPSQAGPKFFASRNQLLGSSGQLPTLRAAAERN